MKKYSQNNLYIKKRLFRFNYAIPFGGLSGCDIFYNKTIFAELGLEVPETIDELEDVCAKLKENGITPFSLANASKWTGSMYYMYLVARHSISAFRSSICDERFCRALLRSMMKNSGNADTL